MGRGRGGYWELMVVLGALLALGAMGVMILGIVMPVRAEASERLCVPATPIQSPDLDARLMRWRPNGYWYVEQRMRLCTLDGSCGAWSAPARFVELTVEKWPGRSFTRFSLAGLDLQLRGDELHALRIRTSGAGDAFRIGRIRPRPILRDYVYRVPSGPGMPVEEYWISIWRLRSRGALRYDVADDHSQACVNIR